MRVTGESHIPGGAGNVVNNLASLGAKVSVLGVVGEDEAGARLVEHFRGRGVNVEGVCVDVERQTTQKCRVIAERQQVVRFDREHPALLGHAARKAALAALETALKSGCEALILSDYGKGLLEPSTIRSAMALAAKRGAPVFVDPKVEHFQLYRGAACITPNTMEAFGGMRLTVRDGQEAAEQLGREIMRKLALRSLLITQGEHGMTLFTRKGASAATHHIPTRAREVYDVTGAGDTVISTLALTWAAGAAPEEAALAANFAAGIVVGKLGTASVTTEELLESAKSWLKTA